MFKETIRISNCGCLKSILLLIALCVPTSSLFAQLSDSAASTIASMSQPEFNLMGFGDISYVSRDSSSQEGFVIGQAVGHLSAYLGNQFSVFSEVSLRGTDSEYIIEVERLFVKYDFSDHFKFSAGRFHTPIGYWNSSFHHGAWLQTTVSRPEIVKFGSNVVPIHFVGALMEGNIPSKKMGLSYMAGFGNGRHANIARAGDAGDINGDQAWLVQLNSAPDNFFGLHMGVGYYADLVSPEGSEDIREETVSAHVAWAKESPEVIFEYLQSKHTLDANSSISGDTRGWYLQLAYRLKGKNRNWKPYARVESTKVDESDPLLGGLNLNYEAGILGVRWDFNPYAALKGEYRNEEFESSGRENNFRVQVSFVLAKL